MASSPCMVFIVLLPFLTGLILVKANDEIKLVRGVELKLQPFYQSTQDFTCLDGSKTIPFSSVNDDYCDCSDGTDEPGTAACPEGKYYCYNIGHKPSYLQSSRVNDGICDCCDGSDEYDSNVVCFNECEKYGREEQEKKNQEMAESIAGAKIKEEYIQVGVETKLDKKKRLETLNGLLEERRRQLAELKAAKDAVEATETEAKLKQEKIWDEIKMKRKEEEDRVERNEAFPLLDADKDGWIAIGELIAGSHMDNDMTENEAKDILGGETMVDPEGFVTVWNAIKPKFLKAGRKFPEAAEFDESNINEATEETQSTSEESVEEEKKEEEKTEEEKHEYDEETKKLIEVADKARNDFQEVDKVVNEMDVEKKDIEDYLTLDFGTNEEFSSLKGHCFTYTDREYEYKLCPYVQVTQKSKDGGGSETDLGNKVSWIGSPSRYSVMKYDAGQTCWNGPARSTVVRLSCGKENVITGVSEPSRCEYEFLFKTPAICDFNKETHDEL